MMRKERQHNAIPVLSVINRLRFRAALLILLSAVCMLSADAQETDAQDEPIRLFEGRLVAGVNMTQVDGDTYSGYHKAGMHAGAMVYVNFSQNWAVSAGLLYSQKGARGAHVRESYYVGTYFDKYYLDLNYVELPLTVHLKIAGFLDFEAGASYARLVSSDERGEADVPVVIDPAFNYFDARDISLLGGASVRLGKKLYANALFQYSLLPVRSYERIPERYYLYPQGQTNNVVTLRLAYVL